MIFSSAVCRCSDTRLYLQVITAIVMEMTLENFRNYVPAKIWHRGKDYYEDGAVAELEEVAHGDWHAVVEGADDYHVEISLAGDRIVSYDCDCPARRKGICGMRWPRCSLLQSEHSVIHDIVILT